MQYVISQLGFMFTKFILVKMNLKLFKADYVLLNGSQISYWNTKVTSLNFYDTTYKRKPVVEVNFKSISILQQVIFTSPKGVDSQRDLQKNSKFA